MGPLPQVARFWKAFAFPSSRLKHLQPLAQCLAHYRCSGMAAQLDPSYSTDCVSPNFFRWWGNILKSLSFLQNTMKE